MDFRILRYFLNVAREQSFTKAAEQLHITQPTLSRQLASLEEELGVTLFTRSGRNITLTEEGLLLKRRALEILDLEERTLEELKSTEGIVEGTVTIGCREFAVVETLAKICELVNWFGRDFKKIRIAFTSNLGTNAGVMAACGLGYPVSIEGAARYWRRDLLVQRPLFPQIKANTVIAWRRNIPNSQAVNKFINEINAFKALESI